MADWLLFGDRYFHTSYAEWMRGDETPMERDMREHREMLEDERRAKKEKEERKQRMKKAVIILSVILGVILFAFGAGAAIMWFLNELGKGFMR